MTSAATTTPTPLDRCPVCRYSLQGLPTVHRCPECGFEYDESTRVFHPKSFWKFGGLGLLIVTTQMPNMLEKLFKRSMSHPLFWIAAIVLIAYTAGILWLIRSYRNHPFLSVGPGGVAHKSQSTVHQLIPWESVAGVELIGKGGSQRVVLKTIGEHAGKIDLTGLTSEPGAPLEFQRLVGERLAGLSDRRTAASEGGSDNSVVRV